jgi:competence protein ComK
MDYSCQYFGSSYVGRVKGSKEMLGVNYKLPIIIEESDDLIFFPISSPENFKCIWISLKWYQDVYEVGNRTYIVLKNGKRIESTASKSSIKNQLMRASRLNLILNERKGKKRR